MDDVGSGCHVHISLWQNGKNVLMATDKSSKHGMSTIGEEFMAGVLYHIPSILPFIAPLPNRWENTTKLYSTRDDLSYILPMFNFHYIEY